MPLLPRRFERLKSVLNHRMADLTVLLEHVEKPHNLSAILRSCDAVGALDRGQVVRFLHVFKQHGEIRHPVVQHGFQPLKSSRQQGHGR